MLVLGAGRMGLGAVHDLVSQPDVTEVTVADYELSKAEAIASRFDKARAAQIDCNDQQAVVALMRGHASAISCVNYWLNERLARAAIEAGTHFCDLGGNNDVVDAELALDTEAKEKGINIIPDCGLAPGMVAVLAAHGAEQFDTLDSIHIRVGGLPQTPKPPLDYQLVFSVEGLINEYIEPARVIRGGKVAIVESMTELESLSFGEEPFTNLEAFQTSGGTSTLVETFLGKVRDLDYKTIRYVGHCAKFKTMIDLGLCSSEAMQVDGVSIKPRRVLGELLVKNLPHDEPDVVLVRVEFAGGGKTLRYDIIDRADSETGLSAMMRTTAFPASIVALMMARNQTTSKGALPQERCIPPQLFMDELPKRNIDVRVTTASS
jgi:lysine 6-dehydrogenase